ncbi:hypothetical protein BN946_scf184857.g47 [Trametes cinnabarina]|uniref:Uncharacterized protein n=1 Tax=Pycnoporus cinnabarinus TaxID=5643 RepID=A0A060SSU3_PYCCI|nr:hypothetical protein BN946_scf184857.g47 [Trametes cinnabarina]
MSTPPSQPAQNTSEHSPSPPPASPSPSPPPLDDMSALVHPAGKRFLMRKSSNAENLPPTISAAHPKKADALVSAREASRRRRARVVSGSLALRKIVQNAQRKASKAHARAAHIKLESLQEEVPSPCETQSQHSAASATQSPQPAAGPSVEFPRWLPRPANFPQFIDRANIDACSESVHGVPHQYILNGLETAGPSMWQLVQNAQFDAQKFAHNLPHELQVVIADYTMWAAASPLPQSFPTHVLALWEAPSASPSPAPTQGGVNPIPGRRKVRLVPVHNLVLAANCAHWFPLPTQASVPQKRVVVNNGGAPGTALTLPVVPLAVPHVESFHQLLYCLYTHKVSKLLDQLVPVARPPFALPSPANPKPANMHYIRETGRRLAARYNPWAIVGMLQHVIGLWKNACYLGVSDRRMWLAIDWSWDMLLTGLAFAVGKPEIVPRPEPKVFKAPEVLAHQQLSQKSENLQQPIRFEGLNRFVIPPPEAV